MSCDQTAQVHAYHDGELPRQQRDAVEAHVKQCADCAALLAELRQMSRLIAAAPMAEISPMALARLQKQTAEAAGHAASDRGVMRVASWLTAVAASILVGAVMFWPHNRDDGPRGGGVEIAIMPPAADAHDDGAANSSDLVVAAQWMANDLTPVVDQTR